VSDDGTAEADRVLVAVGRKAPTADIGLQNVELNPGGFLEVDEQMPVRGVSWLSATGNINGRPADPSSTARSAPHAGRRTR
jgi:pyruvate/2-oxoglutarate dehydrogenase complex dihydrolipoamide dehydrogenase (E3) component